MMNTRCGEDAGTFSHPQAHPLATTSFTPEDVAAFHTAAFWPPEQPSWESWARAYVWPHVCEGVPFANAKQGQPDFAWTCGDHVAKRATGTMVTQPLGCNAPPLRREEAPAPGDDLRVAARTMNVEPETLRVTRRHDGTLQVSLRTVRAAASAEKPAAAKLK